MWTRALLKENAKVAFRRNYWSCVAVGTLTSLLLGGFSIGGSSYNIEVEDAKITIEEFYSKVPMRFWFLLLIAATIAGIIGIAITILVSNVAMVGCCRYFLENREHKTPVSQMFFGFQGGRYSSNVLTLFIRDLYIFLNYLLFIIPGIIKSFSYMMVPFILAENPEMDRKRVLKLSKKMMKGYKMEAFVLGLSFYGWIFLGVLTGGIVDIFYVTPYIHATRAEFYTALKAKAIENGIVEDGELPGVCPVEVEFEV